MKILAHAVAASAKNGQLAHLENGLRLPRRPSFPVMAWLSSFRRRSCAAAEVLVNLGILLLRSNLELAEDFKLAAKRSAMREKLSSEQICSNESSAISLAIAASLILRAKRREHAQQRSSF